MKKDTPAWAKWVSEDPLIQEIIESKKPLLLPSPSQHPAWVRRSLTQNIGSWAGIPLLYRDEAIGILILEHAQQGYFAHLLAGLLETFASQAAIAIHNAEQPDSLDRMQKAISSVNEFFGPQEGVANARQASC